MFYDIYYLLRYCFTYINVLFNTGNVLSYFTTFIIVCFLISVTKNVFFNTK